MGGSDDPSNLIELTVEEHAEAHFALWMKYGKKEDYLAYCGLSGLVVKGELVDQLNRHQASKNQKGRVHTKEHNNKVSVALKGKPKSQSHRDALSLKKSGGGYIITHPCGKEEYVISYYQWCKENNMNKQEFKTLLRNPTRPNGDAGGRRSKLRDNGWKIRKAK